MNLFKTTHRFPCKALVFVTEFRSYPILWCNHDAIRDDIEMIGSDAQDIILSIIDGSDLDPGMYVWEGEGVNYDEDRRYDGSYRVPTDDEWAAIKAGRSPF